MCHEPLAPLSALKFSCRATAGLTADMTNSALAHFAKLRASRRTRQLNLQSRSFTTLQQRRHAMQSNARPVLSLLSGLRTCNQARGLTQWAVEAAGHTVGCSRAHETLADD